jgi:hypothetical protein
MVSNHLCHLIFLHDTNTPILYGSLVVRNVFRFDYGQLANPFVAHTSTT